MEFKELVGITGRLTCVLRDYKGNIKESFTVDNLVVSTGKTYIASRMAGTSAGVMSHMGIGTGTATPSTADTTLATEAGRVSMSSFTASTNTITGAATFPAGTGTGAITEAGIFNASSGGSMLCRTTFPVVTKEAGDSFAISWTVTVS